MAVSQHLEDKMAHSILKLHKRGMRRYFPIEGNIVEGLPDEVALTKCYEIVTGKHNPSEWQLGMFVLNGGDKYIEEFDNQLWVRTIVAL